MEALKIFKFSFSLAKSTMAFEVDTGSLEYATDVGPVKSLSRFSKLVSLIALLARVFFATLKLNLTT